LPSNVTRDNGNRCNRFDRRPGSTGSNPVVKGPPMHLPFRSKRSLPKRTWFPLNRGLMCNM